MDTAKLNDWLALLANVGVVIGLVMLVLEIKHASDLSEVDAYQTRVTEISETAKAMALSDDLAEIYVRLDTENLASLTPVERRRVRAWEVAKQLRMQAQFYQYQRGFLDERSARAMLTAAAATLPLWKALGQLPENAEFLAAVEATSPEGAITF